MTKITLAVFLVGALVVNPCHSCKPADTVSFFKELNENYQLVERVKAAAGEISSSKGSRQMVNVRIAHLRIAHWGAILRWAILSPSVIRIAHPNY